MGNQPPKEKRQVPDPFPLEHPPASAPAWVWIVFIGLAVLLGIILIVSEIIKSLKK